MGGGEGVEMTALVRHVHVRRWSRVLDSHERKLKAIPLRSP